MKIYISRCLPFFINLLLLFFACSGISENQVYAQSQAEPISSSVANGGEYKFPENVCLTEDKRIEIKAEIQESVEKLFVEGKLNHLRPTLMPEPFIFPVRGNGATLNDYGVHGISNLVDHNQNFPNQLTDYNCGTRTYDTAAGYNHKGIDIFSFPFWWYKMDNEQAVAVAAAPGVIVYKSNGNFDRSCSFNNNNWNAVYIQHSDGSVAWYGHLKNNSLTTKNIGQTVEQGEYLGVVGSSGNSTGPHLHFEIYNASNQLQDPYQGPCNLRNNFSYWQNQISYVDSKINKLMTHSAPPVVYSTCPNVEVPNEKNLFKSGEQVIVAAYYRDQRINQQSQLSLIRPDGSVFNSWTHTSPNSYNSSYWYWTITLPSNSPGGTWKFRINYQSTVYEHTFEVQKSALYDFDGDSKADISVFRPENGAWYLNRSTSGFAGVSFGISNDKITPADFDGDRLTDIAVFRDGAWYLQRSQLGFTGIQFGQNGDIPVPADYDGDGKADIAVFRPLTGGWYRLNSSNGQFVATAFGTVEDKPTIGDYDGDGKADIAVFRPSTANWFRLNSSNNQFVAVPFGASDDKLTPADFDGDGKTDIAVFRPSTGGWYRLNSTNGEFVAVGFGTAEDQPVAADYDGDGKTDIAVFRPSDSNWYLLRSTAGFAAVQFGQANDKPVPNAFVQ